MTDKLSEKYVASVQNSLYISIAFLLLAVLPIQDYSFYMLLRWLISGSALFTIYKTHENPSTNKIGFILIALLYNPIAPVYLDNKALWTVINLLVVGYYMYELGKWPWITNHLRKKLSDLFDFSRPTSVPVAKGNGIERKGFGWEIFIGAWCVVLVLVMSITAWFAFVSYGQSKKGAEVTLDQAIAQKFAPKNYELTEYYLENLDNDSEPEAILFFQEHPLYNSNSAKEREGFLSLPVRITILEKDPLSKEWRNVIRLSGETTPSYLKNELVQETMQLSWEERGDRIPFTGVGGNEIISSDLEFPSTFFNSINSTDGKPYKVYELPTEKILAIFHNNSSFDGIVYRVIFFRYNPEANIFSLLTEVKIDPPESYSEILDYDGTLYFTRCNPFLDQSIMEVVRVEIRSNFPERTLTSDLNISCNEYWALEDSGTSNSIKTLLMRHGVILSKNE